MTIRYVQPVIPSTAEGLVTRVYAQIKQDFGALVEPLILHSPSPELLAGAWSACRETLLVGSVRRDVKEAVAATVSRINRCPYCVDAHTIMLNATSAHRIANAINHDKDTYISDPMIRSIVAWAAATRSPDSEVLRSPPFSQENAPEVIGTAVYFHYLNRMVSVFLDETPLPFDHQWMKGTLKRITGWFFSKAVRRPKALGASLTFLPEAELPADLCWAKGAINITNAFARFAAVVDAAGKDLVPEEVRDFIGEQLQVWDGKEPGLSRNWVEERIVRLDKEAKAVGRLLLLTALAPYQVDEKVIGTFTASHPGDDKLLGVLAWGCFTAARRIGSWLSLPC
jgi:AhpD family alkylhydroperoxidase